jgi:hypothetical protein
MSKIVAAVLCGVVLCAAPFSLRFSPEGSVSLSVDRAAAIIGRPLTPLSIAGAHRRAYRRAYRGAYYGYGGYYHPYRRYGYYRPYRLYGYYRPHRRYGYYRRRWY